MSLPPPGTARTADRQARAPLTLLALGAFLARRGILARLSIGVCLLTTAGLVVLGVVMAWRGGTSPAHDVPIVASSALAWGGGFLLAFSASVHVLRVDRASGVFGMAAGPGARLRDYLLMRVGGLAALLFGLVGGGTLLVGVVVAACVSSPGGAWRVLGTTLASIAFSAAFAAVVSPMALAALGARTRFGGYLFLLLVLVLPELVAASADLPGRIRDVLSVPGALRALRSALLPSTFDALRALSALASLSVFGALTTWLVARASALVDEGALP